MRTGRDRMPRTLSVVATLLAVGAAATTTAATVTLTASYDGLPLADVMPAFHYGLVTTYDTVTRERTYLELDLGTGQATFELAEGVYNLGLAAAAAPFDGATRYRPGDLRTTLTGFEAPASGEISEDVAMLSVVHITAPVDTAGPWTGHGASCPLGPEVPASFTLEWDPVPRAVSYEVVLYRLHCLDHAPPETTPVEEPRLEVAIDPATAEALEIVIRAFGTTGLQLAGSPYLVYDDAASNATYVHATGGRGGSNDAMVAVQVASTPGAGDSFWTSDLTLSNPSGSPVTATVRYTPRGDDGRDDYLTATVVLPGDATRTLADVVGSLFGASGAGALEVRPRSVQAWIRTSTPGPAGSYGQGYPLLTPDDPRVARLPDTPRLGAGGVVRGGARTNLGLAEIWGSSATVRVRLADRDGVELGSQELTLGPFGNRQLNDLVRLLTGASGGLTEGRVTVEVVAGDGRVAAALSIVDNGSDDPTTVVLEPY